MVRFFGGVVKTPCRITKFMSLRVGPSGAKGNALGLIRPGRHGLKGPEFKKFGHEIWLGTLAGSRGEKS